VAIAKMNALPEFLTLYRGLAFEPGQAKPAIEKIRAEGLLPGYGQGWRYKPRNLRGKLTELLLKDQLNLNDVHEQIENKDFVCFADEYGARHYASKHWNSWGKTEGVVLNVRLPLNKVRIDPRDFLTPIFTLWFRTFTPVPYTETFLQECAIRYYYEGVLKGIFGPAIEKYFLRTLEVGDGNHRQAIGDLAAADPQVIAHFSGNTRLLQGRGNALFRSAYFADLPISPADIMSIERVEEETSPQNPEIKLTELRNGFHEYLAVEWAKRQG
jgi:hypothetical protein